MTARIDYYFLYTLQLLSSLGLGAHTESVAAKFYTTTIPNNHQISNSMDVPQRHCSIHPVSVSHHCFHHLRFS